MNTYSTKFLNKTVTVTMDRPMWTRHPKRDYEYTLNYWFIPNTIAPDGEELDAYVLWVTEPLQQFTGKCIAIIHRTNDEDDKLIVVPEWINLSDEQIRALTDFQERFFESEIIRK